MHVVTLAFFPVTPAYFFGLSLLPFEKFFNYECCYFIGGAVLRQAYKNHGEPLCKKKQLETRVQRNRGSLPHTPWFLLGSLCLGTSLLIFCDGSALKMGEGNGNGKAPVLGCGMSVF